MKIPVVLGPTAVGKSGFALEVAEKIQGEIVSCDSRQVYRFMDIGTAKPSLQEQKRVPHHLLDCVDPSHEYSAVQWAEAAQQALDDICSRGRIPVICGGSFFYYQVLAEGGRGMSQKNETFRRECHAREQQSPGVLYADLQREDPRRAENIHPHDIYRTIRALEARYYPADRVNESVGGDHEFVPLVLTRPRAELYERINTRVVMMKFHGLIEEFSALLAQGYGESTPGLKSVGYKELFNYIHGKCSLDDALSTIQRNTRRYAKRQLTWIRNKLSSNYVFRADQTCSMEETVLRLVHGKYEKE
ncbi:tRNA (adenosine(37)-N6)-dimethylallyltransferase MiaA [Chitinivibrio alkaliphilus]|uniref:tRNA dimethylallyltransferase n=1 Tax=Chitinivibrio alkaliphilus ACht1 TaxID=1313304 RepID=U7D9Z9_9BACT|nr:tRNA (adenosine(37)-N6)-dimethylallyltransferase MiaA [Chitinivibrio alkaliphilus]ERP38817.1 tRNA delta(2)-isopentenylpyrophosphate transferase [Chitinivibrio alkaliphilus ACht1]